MREDLVEDKGREAGATEAKADVNASCSVYQGSLPRVDETQYFFWVALLPAQRVEGFTSCGADIWASMPKQGPTVDAIHLDSDSPRSGSVLQGRESCALERYQVPVEEKCLAAMVAAPCTLQDDSSELPANRDALVLLPGLLDNRRAVFLQPERASECALWHGKTLGSRTIGTACMQL